MRTSTLLKWLETTNSLIVGNDDRKYTHLCMDGGKFRIEEDRGEEFLKVYGKGVEDGERYFITEMPTPICRMFCDLDFLEKDYEWSLDKFTLVLEELQKVIEEIYGSRFVVIVNTTTPKTVTKNEKDYIKTGIHLIWPKLFVNLKIALKIRSQFIVALLDAFGERDGSNTWDDVVDECVFRTNGLRMIGSAKMVRKKNKMTGRTDFIDEGRIYRPVLTHPDETFLDRFKEGGDRFSQTTIRVRRGTMLTPYKKLDEIQIKDMPEPRRVIRGAKAPQFESQSSEGSFDGTKVKKNSVLFEKTQKFINCLPHWKADTIAIMTKMNPQKDPFYYIAMKGQGHCMNLGRAHNSNRIYFLLRFKKKEKEACLVQKCFCGCATEEGRKNGFCRDFASEEFPVSTLLKRQLFPTPKTMPTLHMGNCKTNKQRRIRLGGHIMKCASLREQQLRKQLGLSSS